MHFAERDMTLTDRKRREEAAHCRTALAAPRLHSPSAGAMRFEILWRLMKMANMLHVAR